MNSNVTGGTTIQQSTGVPRAGGEGFRTNIHTATSKSSKITVTIGNHRTIHSKSFNFSEVQMVQFTAQVKVTFTVSLQVNRIPSYKFWTDHCASAEHRISRRTENLLASKEGLCSMA